MGRNSSIFTITSATMRGLALILAFIGLANAAGQQTVQLREIDSFSVGSMLEDGKLKAAAVECSGLGWVYHQGYCYLFTSRHEDFLIAEELCNEQDAYLADVLSKDENDFIKSVLNVINPKDGTDYWLGGLDADKDKGMQWISGAEMVFKDFKDGEPAGSPYTHMNFDDGFQWDTKDDANDKDNGFICKRVAA